jgi:hypothetical protein
MQVSNCCGEIVDDMGICGKCLEHCIAVTDWLEAIRDERKKQVEIKGYTAEHDDKHTDGFLADSAAYFAEISMGDGDKEYLVKAGAFIVAELERRERAKK